MPYARVYNFKGIEPLQANVLRILERDLPAEIALINAETAPHILPPFVAASFLKAEKADPTLPCIVVSPEEDDTVENEGRSAIDEANVLNITIVAKPQTDLNQLTLEIMRYKRAVRSVLWAATKADLLLGVTALGGSREIRGGRYTWVKIGNVFGRAVRDMKFIVRYAEVIS